MIRGISYINNRVNSNIRMRSHSVSEFKGELKALGIPSDVIDRGIGAVKEYAASHGISLPKELELPEGQVTPKELEKAIEKTFAEIGEVDKEDALKERLDSLEINSKDLQKADSSNDSFAGADQMAALNKHFFIKKSHDKKEY